MYSGFVLLILTVGLGADGYEPKSNIGIPNGLIPECPGVQKNASISRGQLARFQVVLHTLWGGAVRRRPMPITGAYKALAADKTADFKKRKTVLYAVGFFDSSSFPQSLAVGAAYARRGYNVLVTETFQFLTEIYPISVRLARYIGRRLGELLFKLHRHQGLDPRSLELVGLSLGAHVVGYAAKHFYSLSGLKPARITGLDPAGPCFRSLPPSMRLDSTDGERVDVVHTNIDGFGMAEPLGHVDYYVNGGEFQPSDIPYIPCLVVCSHIRSVIYWWQALEHPKEFIAVQCDSVQQARNADCYNSTVKNYLGLLTRFDRKGIFYLPTKNEFPYFMGRDGLKADNEIYKAVVRSINSQDNIEV